MSHRAQAERQERRRLEILSTQVRLLYANADLGVCVTVLAATVVSGLQWGLNFDRDHCRVVDLHGAGIDSEIRIGAALSACCTTPG